MPLAVGGTYSPTSTPTFRPSRDYTSYKETTLYPAYESMLSADKYPIKFSSFTYKDSSMEVNSCFNWQNFLQQGIDNLPFDNGYISSMTFKSSNENLLTGEIKSLVATCSDKTLVSFMVDKLTAGSQLLVFCNGFTWRSFACKGRMILCVNCPKDCSLCPGNDFVLRPCFSGCYTDTAAYSILSFDVKAEVLYPVLQEPIRLVNISTTSVTAVLNISKVGSIYCAALPNVFVPLSVSSLLQYDQVDMVKLCYIFTILYSLKFI